MADISAEITAFKNAVYGEDVRDAMVSLANKLNNVVGESFSFHSNPIKGTSSLPADLNDYMSNGIWTVYGNQYILNAPKNVVNNNGFTNVEQLGLLIVTKDNENNYRQFLLSDEIVYSRYYIKSTSTWSTWTGDYTYSGTRNLSIRNNPSISSVTDAQTYFEKQTKNFPLNSIMSAAKIYYDDVELGNGQIVITLCPNDPKHIVENNSIAQLVFNNQYKDVYFRMKYLGEWSDLIKIYSDKDNDELLYSLIDLLPIREYLYTALKKDETYFTSSTTLSIISDLPNNVSTIYLTGTASWTANVFYAVYFLNGDTVLQDGRIIQTVSPETWTNYAISVPNNATSVVYNKSLTISTSLNYDYDLNKRLRNIEYNDDRLFINFESPYTWATRDLGLRILADAQGCYFIPFNAIGMGRSRGNGLYGDDYVTDQIHPTDLGGYNVAMGVWSYLKNIPCWYTSIPNNINQPLDGSQWNGKTWYCYGTSLTMESSGKYADYVAAMSGMTVVNKGRGGGALVTNRNIYNRLLDMDDGKLEADLITIEVGANDRSDLGSPWSTDTGTFYGALNHCIREMFAAGIQAQVVIMASYPGRYKVGDPNTKYDVDDPATVWS